MKKLLVSSLVFLFCLSMSVSVLADEKAIELDWIEEDPVTNEIILLKVLEDMENNPEKVEMATQVDDILFIHPTDISVNNSLYPVIYTSNDLRFKAPLLSRVFNNSPWNSMSVSINNTGGTQITLSLYKSNGTFVGSRKFNPKRLSRASFSNTGTGNYYFVLTSDSTLHYATGYLWIQSGIPF